MHNNKQLISLTVEAKVDLLQKNFHKIMEKLDTILRERRENQVRTNCSVDLIVLAVENGKLETVRRQE